MTLWNYFSLAFVQANQDWTAYEYANQPPGTGDLTLDAANVSSPQNKNLVKSEVGGAWSYWATLVNPKVPSIGKNPLVPGRNGRVGAIGLRKGVFGKKH